MNPEQDSCGLLPCSLCVQRQERGSVDPLVTPEGWSPSNMLRALGQALGLPPPLCSMVSKMLSELAAVEIAVGVTASPSIDLSSIGELLRSVCTLSAAPWSISQTHRSNFPATPHLQTCSCVVACYAVSATCLWLRGRVRTLPPAQQHLWHLMLLGTLCWDVLSLKGFWKGSVF